MGGKFEKAEDARKALIVEFGHLPKQLRLAAAEFFIARLMIEFGECVTLKGGMAARLRLDLARSTEDVDLNLFLSDDSDVVLARLRSAADLDLGDFCILEVSEDLKHPEITAEEAAYGGRCYRVKGKLAGKGVAEFKIDICFAEPMILDVEVLEPTRAFDVLGLKGPSIRVYPLETQIAEKFYIFAGPRLGRPNSRTKDLPDIALLAGQRPIDSAVLRDVLIKKFELRVDNVRRTRPEFEFALPSAVPPLPVGNDKSKWDGNYLRILQDQPALKWKTLEDCHDAVCAFLNPVLAGADGTWRPEQWAWGKS